MAAEPQKLGKYNIVGKIGKGAMGEVYKGHDPILNRFVAIKIIAETLGTDTDLVERFKREARNAAGLNHPNIITIYDFVEEEGHLYMVMELLEGQDLKELIKSGSPLTMEQILSIMEQIADGLGFAHTRGMIHRDLKPANIHVSKNGQVKILDFGLVHEASSDMTKTGQVMGTPNYMSPEQVQGLQRGFDSRHDVQGRSGRPRAAVAVHPSPEAARRHGGSRARQGPRRALRRRERAPGAPPRHAP
jgi:serine/threonine-protein kinase